MILLHVGDHLSQATTFWDLFAFWDVEIFALITLLIIFAAYVIGFSRLRLRGRYSAVSTPNIVFFSLSIIVLLISLVSPIDTFGSDLFFVHMIQHILIVMIAAPLILLASSMRVFIWSLPKGPRYKVGHWLSKGGFVRKVLEKLTSMRFSFLIYYFVAVFWHIPIFYDAALSFSPLHYFEHLTMLFAALIFWWPVIGSAPVRARQQFPVRMLYLFLATILNTALGVTLAFARGTIYSFYEDAPRHWGISLAQDLQTGGLIMWVPGNMMYLIALATVFLVWANREERDNSKIEKAQEKRDRYMQNLNRI